MHVHIALIGGQPVPILTVIDALCQGDCPIDKVVAVYSKESKAKLGDVKKSDSIKNLSFVEIELDGSDITEISPKFAELANKYNDVERLSVNLSSGTKAWTFFAIQELQRLPNVEFFYVDKTNILFNLTAKTSFAVEPSSFDTIKSDFVRLSDYTDAEQQDLKKVEEFRSFNPEAFKALTDKDNAKVSKVREKGLMFRTDDGLSYKLNANDKTFILNSPKTKSLLFNYGWFEYKVAKYIELCSWEDPNGELVKPMDICLNNVFKNKAGNELNEIDIRFEAAGRQFFVEVKTYIDHHNELDKFNTVVERVAGSGALKLFVSEGTIKQQAKDKCAMSGISYYRIQNESGKFKGKNKDDETIVKELSAILKDMSLSKNV